MIKHILWALGFLFVYHGKTIQCMEEPLTSENKVVDRLSKLSIPIDFKNPQGVHVIQEMPYKIATFLWGQLYKIAEQNPTIYVDVLESSILGTPITQTATVHELKKRELIRFDGSLQAVIGAMSSSQTKDKIYIQNPLTSLARSPIPEENMPAFSPHSLWKSKQKAQEQVALNDLEQYTYKNLSPNALTLLWSLCTLQDEEVINNICKNKDNELWELVSAQLVHLPIQESNIPRHIKNTILSLIALDNNGVFIPEDLLIDDINSKYEIEQYKNSYLEDNNESHQYSPQSSPLPSPPPTPPPSPQNSPTNSPKQQKNKSPMLERFTLKKKKESRSASKSPQTNQRKNKKEKSKSSQEEK